MSAYIVLSQPPAGVSADEFNKWYDLHIREIIALPGFVAAERNELRFLRSTSGEAPPFGYSARFEIDGDLQPAWQELRNAVDGGHMTFPDWFSGFSSVGWELMPLGGRVVADQIR